MAVSIVHESTRVTLSPECGPTMRKAARPGNARLRNTAFGFGEVAFA
jgi:hypothetical protein